MQRKGLAEIGVDKIYLPSTWLSDSVNLTEKHEEILKVCVESKKLADHGWLNFSPLPNETAGDSTKTENPVTKKTVSKEIKN